MYNRIIWILIAILTGVILFITLSRIIEDKVGDPQFNDIEDFDYRTLTFQEATYNPRKVKFLVVHCTDNPLKYPHTVTTLNNLFYNEFGWSKPGYRHFVDIYGITWDLVSGYDFDNYISYNEITYGARGYNSNSIHIAYDGGFNGMDTRTKEQKQSLAFLISMYTKIYPDIIVIPHYYLNPNKQCPSFNVFTEYGDMVEISVDLTPDFLN